MRLHYAFYVAALVSTVGMWLQWDWVKGVFDGWFPMFCVVMGQLARLRSGAPSTIFDRPFENARLEKFAIASIAAVVVGIAGWAAWIVYVENPRLERLGIQEYLDARARGQK